MRGIPLHAMGMLLADPAGVRMLSDAVVIALVGGVATTVGAVMKIRADKKIAQLQAEVEWAKSDAAKTEAEAAREASKAAAIDEAAQRLRESLTTRVTTLEERLDRMYQDRHVDIATGLVLVDVLTKFPDPPGAPMIPAAVAAHVGWEQPLYVRNPGAQSK